MNTSYECQNCSNIISSSDDKCPYCGTIRINKNEPLGEGKNPFFNEKTKQSAEKIDWVIFIILLIVFAPAAIIYAVIKMSEK